MSDQRGERLERAIDAFGELCDLTPEEQRARLAALEKEDSDLAQHVADLLRDDREADERIDKGALAHLPSGALSGLEGEVDEFTSKVMERLGDHQGSFRRYEIKGEVARGGQGVVLRIRDEVLDRDLAMKVVLGDGDSERTGKTPRVDTKTLGRFLEEAQVTGSLNHPGIVPVHDLGLDGRGRAYFTMKLVKGKTLMDVFAELAEGRGDWTQTQVLGVLLKVCDAVSYAHAKGIVHRDLKPSNIMVGPFGEVYVMDWGLAKILGQEDEKDTRLRPESAPSKSGAPSESHDPRSERKDSPLHTKDGDVLGTPAYMSPEQATGRVTDMGPPSDVYAMGAMLYHLIAQHMPYVALGTRLSDYAVLAQVKTGPPRPLEEEAPEAPAELVAICDKAMGREPAERYADMSALGEDLGAFVEGRVVHAYETGAWAEARKWVRRNRSLAASLAGLLVVTIGGLGAIGYVKAEGQAAERTQRELAVHNAATAEMQRARAEEAEKEAHAEAERATLAEADARVRAEELEQVATFQAEQLSQLDVELMGVRLRRALTNAAPEERREELRGNLAGLNFTSLALGALRENLFELTIAAIDEQFASQPLVRARLLQTMADSLRDLGLLEMATDPQERALEIRYTELGGEHHSTLISISAMGQLRQVQGKLAEAEHYLREALVGFRSALGDEARNTVASIHNLGFLFEAQGRLAEAESCLHEALASSRHVLGEDHSSTLASKNDYARVLQAQGRLSEAESYFCELLESRRRVSGNDDPGTLNAANNLGVLLQLQGRFSEAEPYYREALQGRRNVLGDEHPKTLNSINNMGVLLQLQGRFSEAEPYYLESLDGHRRVLGNEHPATLTSIRNMSFLLQAQGKLADAESHLREALDGFRRALGSEHPDTLGSMSNMGVLLQAQGRLMEAEPYLREALDGYRRTLGIEHTSTLTLVLNLGYLLETQGKLSEAETLTREAAEGFRLVLGDEHPTTLVSINNMGHVLQARGRLKEAEPYYREALEASHRTLGEDHPDTLRSTLNMGQLLQDQGKLTDAEAYYREALDGYQRLFGDEHPRTLIAMNDLGGVLWDQGKPSEAEALGREAVAGARRALGDEHPDTLTSIHNMGVLLHDRGKLAEADAFLSEALETTRAVLGDEHPSTRVVTRSMEALLRDLESSARASGDDARLVQALVRLGAVALLQSKHAQGETALAEALDLLCNTQPDTAGRFEVQNNLGAAIAAQGRYFEAEPLLAESAEWMLASSPALAKGSVERMIDLYDEWHAAEPEQGFDKVAEDWRVKLQALTQGADE
jgi:serine/threonine protein kinase/tetratricopeptide (TPR) repeat protein